MGSGIELPLFSYTDIFEDVFPSYMAMGMSYDEFWHDDPKKAIYYRKAQEIKLKQMNEQLWLQGVYMAQAINSTVGNMLSKKGSEKIEYFKEPLPITKADIEEKKKRERTRQQEQAKMKFMQMALSLNANRSRRKGGIADGRKRNND